MATYVFSDLHGQYNLWKQIKNYLKPQDKAYCLGDCTDRGKDGIVILLDILRDNRITLLKGNHEQFIEDFALEFAEGHFENAPYWWSNGGEKTWDALSSFDVSSIYSLVRIISKLPKRIDITNAKNQKIILTHCGINPWITEEEFLLKNKNSDYYLWDRTHIPTNWNKNKEYENIYIIHGHTPVLLDSTLLSNMENYDKNFLEQTAYKIEVCPNTPIEMLVKKDFIKNPTISKYCNGHKICIDMGSYYSDTSVLLNLDTFEPIYFKQ